MNWTLSFFCVYFQAVSQTENKIPVERYSKPDVVNGLCTRPLMSNFLCVLVSSSQQPEDRLPIIDVGKGTTEAGARVGQLCRGAQQC